MKWEEEAYTRKDENGNLVSIVRRTISNSVIGQSLTLPIGGV